jgi:hypothetical protein
MLDALREDELVTTKWVTPEPQDFECQPQRPGAAQFLHSQKAKIRHNQRIYKERKAWEGRRQAQEREEEEFGGEEEGGAEEEEEVGRTSVMSANTSVTMMKSEFSMGAGL